MENKKSKETIDQIQKKLIEKINGSIVFSMNKQEDPYAYTKERTRLQGFVAEYLYNEDDYYNNKDKEEKQNGTYSDVMLETIESCIDAYDPEKAKFFDYFISSWKRNKSLAMSKFIQRRAYGGLSISDSSIREYAKYRNLVKNLKNVPTKENEIGELAKKLGISENNLKECINRDVMAGKTVFLNGNVFEDESVNQYESIVEAGELSVERQYEEQDTTKMLFQIMEDVFSSLQDRQKPLASDLITLELLKENLHLSCDIEKYLFFSQDVFDMFLEKRENVSKRDIAYRYDRDEASISRTWSQIQEKMIKRKNEIME